MLSLSGLAAAMTFPRGNRILSYELKSFGTVRKVSTRAWLRQGLLRHRAKSSMLRLTSRSTRNRLMFLSAHATASERATWSSLGVTSPELTQALSERMGIDYPNDLQKDSTPCILEGRDAVLSSYTGSGKTIAGLLPLIQRLVQDKAEKLYPRTAPGVDDENYGEIPPCEPALIVVAPTRELSLQIMRVMDDLLDCQRKVRTLTEKEYLRHTSTNNVNVLLQDAHPDVLVATPKELLLLNNQRALSFAALRYLMLDEVDMLVDTDKYKLDRLFQMFPETRVQTVLASASALAHPDMKKFVPSVLQEGWKLIDSNFTDEESKGDTGLVLAPTLKHAICEIRNAEGEWASPVKKPEAAFQLKFELLKELLSTRPKGESTLVFVHKKSSSTRELLQMLKRSYINAELLSGTRRIQRRNLVTWELMEGDGRVVVATDELAARGLDYQSVTMVINFDLPYGVKNYLHRAGRAGRAGREGVVLSMVSNAKEDRYYNDKLLGRLGALSKFEAKMTRDTTGSNLHYTSIVGENEST